VILIKNICTLWGRKRVLLFTYFPTNLVYPFTLRVNDSASDPDREYIYFMGSETLPSACYIHFATNLVYPFTLRVTGIKNKKLYSRYPFTLRVTGIKIR